MKRIHLLIIICLSLTNLIFYPPAASAQVFDFQWGTTGLGQGQFNQEKKTLLEHCYELADQMNGLSPEPEQKGNRHEEHALVQMGL